MKRSFIILTILLSSPSMSESINIVDIKKLENYRIETTVSGYYLKAWNVLVESKAIPKSMDQYLVSFLETENEVTIYLTKPVTERILGGGNGKFVISKQTFEIVEGSLSK